MILSPILTSNGGASALGGGAEPAHGTARTQVEPLAPGLAPTPVLVWGGSGLLGGALVRRLTQDCRDGTTQPRWRVVAPTRAQCDVRSPEQLVRWLRESGAVLAFNCTAAANVDACEADPALAQSLNVDSVLAMREAADAAGTCLVHFSTDYVFDGLASTPYTEADEAQPINVYGRSKLAGECAVLDALPALMQAPDTLHTPATASPHVVFRVSWLYAPGGANFFGQVLLWLQQDRELAVVDDHISVPNSVESVAAALAQWLARWHAVPAAVRLNGAGLFHLVGPQAMSRYAFALAAAAELGPLALARLKPVHAAELAQGGAGAAAPRPRYTVLCAQRLAQVWGVQVGAQSGP